MSYEGDVILAPGVYKGEAVNPREIMYSMSGLMQKGGTLKPGQGDLVEGTVLSFDSATNRYEKAADAASAVGFLRLGVSTGSNATDHPHQCLVVLAGAVKSQYISGGGGDAAALADALGGKYDEDRGYIKF